jgi:hypothetical protein
MSTEAEVLQPPVAQPTDSEQSTEQKENPQLTEAQKEKIKTAVEKVIAAKNEKVIKEANEREMIERMKEKKKREEEEEAKKNSFKMTQSQLEELQDSMQQLNASQEDFDRANIVTDVAQHVLDLDEDTLSQLSEKVLIQRYKTLSRALHPSAIGEEQQAIINEALDKITKQAMLKGVDLPDLTKKPEEDLLQATPQNFQLQMIRQWESAVTGGAVEFVESEDVTELSATREENGKVIVKIPINAEKPPTLREMLIVAQKIAPELDASQKTRSQMFAKNLKDTAILLAQQKTGSGKTLFSDAYVEELYNTAIMMDAAVTGREIPEQFTRVQIEAEVIRPLLYERFPERQEIDREAGLEDIRVEDRKKAVVMFLLGKRDLIIPGEKPTEFYEQWFDLAKDHEAKNADGTLIKTHEEFEEYAYKRFRAMLPFLANAIEHGTSARLQQQKAVAEFGPEAILESISQKGEAIRQSLYEGNLYKDMAFSNEYGQTLSKLSAELIPQDTLIENVTKQLQVIELLNANSTLTPEEKTLNQLEALNQAIYETYQFPEEPSPELARYAPILALKNGEFACTIRARVLNDLIQKYMGDRFVSLVGTELGHETNFLVERNSLFEGKVTGYLMSTGGENGYDITLVTDERLHTPVMDQIKAAIIESAESSIPVSLHVEFDFDNPEVAERFNKYMTLTEAKIGLDANDWVNFAAVGVDKDGNELDLETRLIFAQRARYLDPNNVNAWRAIAQLTNGNPDMVHLHNTALQKVLALNPDATLEDILYGEATVNAPPVLNSTDLNVIPNVQDRAYVELVLNPRAAQNQFSEQEIEKARNILINAYIGYGQNTPERATLQTALDRVGEVEQSMRDNQRRYQERREEEPTLFQLTEVDKREILRVGPVRWFLETSALDFANRWSSGVIPGGTAFEAFQGKLRDAATYVTSLDEATVTQSGWAGTIEDFRDQREDFLKLQGDITNVVLATTYFQEGGEKSLQEAQSKLQSLSYEGIYRIRNLEEGKIGFLSQRYLQKLDLRRIQDGGYIQTYSIMEVQNEIVQEIFDEASQDIGEYAEKYKQIKNEIKTKLAEALFRERNPGATRTEARRTLNDPANATLKQQLENEVEMQQKTEWDQLTIQEFRDVVRAHLVVARWTNWAVLDEPAITSKGIPKNKEGSRTSVYSGRPSLWSHLQDMVRWGSLTDQQESFIWGPFRRRIIENALKALVTKDGRIDPNDPWNPNHQNMRDLTTDSNGIVRSRFEIVENDDFFNQVGFLSDRGIDSIWRMGDRSGMDRPYLDVLYRQIVNQAFFDQKFGNGEWLLRDPNTGKVLLEDGYQRGLDFGLFLQLHTAVADGVNIDKVRERRYEIWAGRIAKYQPELALKQVYEKDPFNEDFIDLFTNDQKTEWLEKLYNAKLRARNSNDPDFSTKYNERVRNAVETQLKLVREENKRRASNKPPLPPISGQNGAAIRKAELARFRFEVFMENVSEQLWVQRQKGFNKFPPEAIDFGTYNQNGSQGPVFGDVVNDFNTYFSKLTGQRMQNVGQDVMKLMNEMTKTVRGGERERSQNDEKNSIAWQLGNDAKYQAALYRRALSDRDSLMEQKRYREVWGQDLSNKGTNLSALMGDLAASEQVMNIFVYSFAKADFNNREEIFKQVIQAGTIVQGPKGEGFRTKIIDDWLGSYLYAMRLGSNAELDQPKGMGALLNFIEWNMRSKSASLAKSQFGAAMIGFSDEQIESYVNNQLLLYLQGDPVRAEEFYRFLGIKRGRIVNRSILRLIWALVIGAMMEATNTSVDLVGNQQGM